MAVSMNLSLGPNVRTSSLRLLGCRPEADFVSQEIVWRGPPMAAVRPLSPFRGAACETETGHSRRQEFSKFKICAMRHLAGHG
jgi:hypothetical protein